MHLREDNVTIRIGKGIGNILEKELNSAQNRVWVVSPWLSEKYALLLARKGAAGLDVRLITTNDNTNHGHIRALQALSTKRTGYLVSLSLIGFGLGVLFRGAIGLLFVLGSVILLSIHLFSKPAKAKVQLTIKDRNIDFVHSKIYVIDSKAMISSANLTYSGLKKNYETLVIFEKESVVESIAETYEELEGKNKTV